MIVVDASVAAKWYLPEAGTEAALAVVDGPHQLVAPGLIRLEVLAAISRKARTGESTVAAAEARCEDWRNDLQAGTVKLVPDEELEESALRLALGLRHPLQDCLYLAAAIRLEASLLTADPTFHRRAGRQFERVSLLQGCAKS